MLFLVLSVTDFRLCVQLLSGDTNKMLSAANLKAVFSVFSEMKNVFG